jgi:hypothetical protein
MTKHDISCVGKVSGQVVDAWTYKNYMYVRIFYSCPVCHFWEVLTNIGNIPSKG